MKLVIFGLTVSSSWGNGHATLWRGLCRALARRGHRVVFFERDVPYYAANRDLTELPGGRLVLYPDWDDVAPARGARELRDADVAMVTSYCPDGVAATELVLGVRRAACARFYDLDTPVTLARARRRRGGRLLSARAASRDFDLVLSYTGGAALDELRRASARGAWRRSTAASIPTVHRPAAPLPSVPRRPLVPRHLCRRPAGARSRSCSSSRRGACRERAS